MENKFHFAITGKTAAEIIYDSADRDKEHMGLTTWKNSPNGRILQSDVVVAGSAEESVAGHAGGVGNGAAGRCMSGGAHESLSKR